MRKFQKANWSNGTCSNDDSAESGNGHGKLKHHKQRIQ